MPERVPAEPSAQTPQSLTLVAVLRIDPNRPISDLDRFLALALPSFTRFLERELVSELVLIVPSTDVRAAGRRLRRCTAFPVRIVDEAEVLRPATRTGAGWVTQQIVKLAAASVVNTEWFITIDADVIATRRVDRDFLFPDGRAVWQQESGGAHLDWWRASARFLHSTAEVHPQDPAFGVTPALMHAPSLRTLADRIEAIYPGRSWVETLFARHDAGWTEYTLYWTHVLGTGDAAVLYDRPGGTRRPYSLEGSVWVGEQVAVRGNRAALAGVFAPDADHAFVVYQSTLERPLGELVDLVGPFLGRGSPTVAERGAWSAHAAKHSVRTLGYKGKAALVAGARRAGLGGLIRRK